MGYTNNRAQDPEEQVYQEDSEDFKAPQQPRYARVTALVLGLLSLVGIGAGIYFFMDKHGYSLKKDTSRNENFQGTVSLLAVAEHQDPEDCWVAFHGNVYDMTEYAPIHPGSLSFITNHCGTDATVWFDYEHPVSYLPLVDKYLLGTLISDELTGAGGTSSASPTVSPITGAQSATTFQPTARPISASTATPTVQSVATSSPTLSPGTETPSAATSQPAGIQSPTVSPIAAQPIASSPTAAPVTVRPTPSPIVVTQAPTAAPVIQGCEMQRYTLTDISGHNDESSCWYGLYGVVYDFTGFIDRHPGGRGTILFSCGTDATTAFENEKNHNVNLLLSQGSSSYIIGRQGSTSGIEIVPCDEVGSVSARRH